tara:strand:+ start:395 stop:865 length:471 start_codon:yes stop_codon:yes gene_type:complete
MSEGRVYSTSGTVRALDFSVGVMRGALTWGKVLRGFDMLHKPGGALVMYELGKSSALTDAIVRDECAKAALSRLRGRPLSQNELWAEYVSGRLRQRMHRANKRCAEARMDWLWVLANDDAKGDVGTWVRKRRREARRRARALHRQYMEQKKKAGAM